MSDIQSFVFGSLFDWSWLRRWRRQAAPPALNVEELPKVSAHLRRDIGLTDCEDAEEQLRRLMEWRL